MLRKEIKKGVFSTLLSKLKPAATLDEELSYADQMFWDWSLGHESAMLPFRSIPITIRDILGRNWSLKRKIKTIFESCIKPICQRRVHWSTGGSGNMHFHWFEWSTLKQGYQYSFWIHDRYQRKCQYEKSIFKKQYDLVKTECFDQYAECDEEITEQEYERIEDSLRDEEDCYEY